VRARCTRRAKRPTKIFKNNVAIFRRMFYIYFMVLLRDLPHAAVGGLQRHPLLDYLIGVLMISAILEASPKSATAPVIWPKVPAWLKDGAGLAPRARFSPENWVMLQKHAEHVAKSAPAQIARIRALCEDEDIPCFDGDNEFDLDKFYEWFTMVV
jgi:hypothetical protein